MIEDWTVSDQNVNTHWTEGSSTRVLACNYNSISCLRSDMDVYSIKRIAGFWYSHREYLDL